MMNDELELARASPRRSLIYTQAMQGALLFRESLSSTTKAFSLFGQSSCLRVIGKQTLPFMAQAFTHSKAVPSSFYFLTHASPKL